MVFSVVDVKHGILLSENALTLGLVKYCFQITKTEDNKTYDKGRKEAEKIITRYREVFEGYECIPAETSFEVDETVQPEVQPARRIPISLREGLKEELTKLEKESIIAKEHRMD